MKTNLNKLPSRPLLVSNSGKACERSRSQQRSFFSPTHSETSPLLTPNDDAASKHMQPDSNYRQINASGNDFSPVVAPWQDVEDDNLTPLNLTHLEGNHVQDIEDGKATSTQMQQLDTAKQLSHLNKIKKSLHKLACTGCDIRIIMAIVYLLSFMAILILPWIIDPKGYAKFRSNFNFPV